MENKTNMRVSFAMRVIHNQVKDIICKSGPKLDAAPPSQLQGGIMGYLYHHVDAPVYQRDIEKAFHISRATATNTLQVMEKNGLILRKSQDKDARLKRIIMTETAFSNHAKVEAHMAMMENRMLYGLTEEEISDLHRYLGIIMQNLETLKQEYSRNSETEAVEDCGVKNEKAIETERKLDNA